MDFLVSAGGIITMIISVFAILAAIILNVRTGAVHFKLIGKIRTRSLSARGTAVASLGMGIGAEYYRRGFRGYDFRRRRDFLAVGDRTHYGGGGQQ